MATLILVLQIFSCLFLISLILVQRGQGADIGAAFGGASQTVFGSRGPATFLNKLTIIVAVIFLVSSIYLAQAAKHQKAASIIDAVKDYEKAEEVIDEKIDKAIDMPIKEEKAAPETVPAKETPAKGVEEEKKE